MKTKPGVAGGLAAALFCLFVSCGEPSLKELVPANALGILQVTSLKDLTTNLDGFIKAVDLGAILPKNQTSLDLVRPYLDPYGIQIDWIDMDRPLLAVLLPPTSDSPLPMNPWVYVPLRDGEKNVPSIQKILEETGRVKSLYRDGYLVLWLTGGTEPRFPLAHSMDPQNLTTPDKGAVSFSFSLENLSKMPGSHWEETKAAARLQIEKALDDAPSLGSPAQAQGLKALLQTLVDGFFQIRNVSVSLALSQDGFQLKTGLDFLPGGSVEKALSRFPAAHGTLDFTKYLWKDGLLGLAFNLDPQAAEALATPFSQTYYKTMGLPETVVAKLLDYLKNSYRLLGGRGALALDINPQWEKIQALQAESPDSIPAPRFFEALGLRFLSVVETKDGQAYRNLQKDFYQSGVLNEMMADLLRSPETPLDLQFGYSPDQKDQGFLYDTISFRFRVLDLPKKDQIRYRELAAAKPVLEALAPYLKVDQAVRGQKVYYAFGPEGLQELKTLVDQDQVAPKASDSQALKRLKSTYPDDATFLFNLSPWKLLRGLTGGAAGLFGMPEGDDNPGLVGYGKILGGHVEGGLALQASELKVLIQDLSFAFLGAKF